ncbi:MAG: putative transposase [Motiliproteus sp.]
MRRISYLRWFEKHNKAGWTAKNLEPLLKEASQHLQGPLPNWRTLAGWRSAYEQSGRSAESLAPNHHRKGNREAKVLTDALYYWRAVNEKYLRRERPSIAAAYEYYKDLITLANRDLVEGRIDIISARAFYNRIEKLPPYDVALARYGKRYADRCFQSVGAHIKPTRVLERVEIDHTPLDLILMDDTLGLPLGRPYLTALIDSYSGCLVGFYLGYNEPSYNSVRKALLNSCLSKDYVKKQYPSVKNEWRCEGKIETLVVDNGAEFWSKNLEHACRAVVSDIQYNPVARPWLKPMIERFFGTINRKLLVSIPGKTFQRWMSLRITSHKKTP